MTRLIAFTALAILVSLPFVLSGGVLALTTEMLVLLAIAQSWNLLAGYGGLLSLGHHAFVAVGAYLLFAVTRDLPISPYVMIPFCGVGAGAFGVDSDPNPFSFARSLLCGWHVGCSRDCEDRGLPLGLFRSFFWFAAFRSASDRHQPSALDGILAGAGFGTGPLHRALVVGTQPLGSSRPCDAR